MLWRGRSIDMKKAKWVRPSDKKVRELEERFKDENARLHDALIEISSLKRTAETTAKLLENKDANSEKINQKVDYLCDLVNAFLRVVYPHTSESQHCPECGVMRGMTETSTDPTTMKPEERLLLEVRNGLNGITAEPNINPYFFGSDPKRFERL
jgi:hypothetical protein